jgi:kynurenine formamidase
VEIMAEARATSSRNIAVSRQAVDEAFKALSNWGRWGKDDQIGTLNNITPQDVVDAAKLVRRGRIFALGIPLGPMGPQRGLFGKRWNPIHTMLATGTDALAGRQPRLSYADDAINMPVQAASHWDSLGHIFYDDKMYNGHHASNVDSNGLGVLGIEHAKDKLVGRGVLLDIARWKGVDALKDGTGISNDELDACAAAQKVEVRNGDFVIVRTGQMEACTKKGEWGGYAGGDAPGLKFETCYWLQEKQVGGVCSDTWGVEVRPNETKDVNQPWHWVVIPAMGLYMAEMLDLAELAQDCAKDKVYEFFFCAPPLVIPGGTGSPINPQAIK